MNIEILIYIVISCILMSLRRILSGYKNGCFYHKNDNPKPKNLSKYIKNLHFIESPSWFTQFGAMFFMILAITRLLNPIFELKIFLIQLLSTFLIVYGTSGSANYFYQKGVTGGRKDSELDMYSGNFSEFAFYIFGKKISFWWKRPFKNKGRIFVMILGIISTIIGIWLLFFI